MVDLICDAIVFDLDGVLVDSSVVVERHWRRWAARRGVDYETIAPVMHGRRSAEVIVLVAPHLDAERESRALDADEALALAAAELIVREVGCLRIYEQNARLVITAPTAPSA
jgi:mannitol-1-/sugar-/sorbitol-6-phosphatase